MSKARVCSLFSGIAGLELGFSASDFEPIMFCENDLAAQAVLADRFPDVPIAGDISTLKSLPRCEVLTAGWPCQDLSQAGSVRGLKGARSGLIDDVFRLLAASRQKPQFVVLENVAFALHLHGGAAVQRAVAGLEDAGYHWAYRILDTQCFGLPQRRRRIFIVASRNDTAANVLFPRLRYTPSPPQPTPRHVGFYWTEGNRGTGWTPGAVPPLKGGSGLSIPSPPAVWDRSEGKFFTPGLIDAERLQGFAANWTRAASGVSMNRVRWRLVGNAVSVPVARWIGSRIARALHGNTLTLGKTRTVHSARRHNAAIGASSGTERFHVELEGPSAATMNIDTFRFIDHTPLSYRAAHGFLSRLLASPLSKDPEFIDDLESYCRASRAPQLGRSF